MINNNSQPINLKDILYVEFIDKNKNLWDDINDFENLYGIVYSDHVFHLIKQKHYVSFKIIDSDKINKFLEDFKDSIISHYQI